MMKWHGIKIGHETDRFKYGDKVYLYNPNTHEHIFIGRNCGKHKREPLYYIELKNSIGCIALYNEYFIRSESEIMLNRKR